MKTKMPKDYPPPSRPVTMGANGMVASAHPLASLAGVRVLSEGGNAFDAALTTATTLGVVEPYMSGIGGIGVALAYIAKEDRVRALDFSGRAPKEAEPELFTTESLETGVMAPMVPGNAAGWLTLHDAYGTMDRERLFRPAIQYATEGFPLTYFNNKTIAAVASKLRGFASSTSVILGCDGRVPPPGARTRFPQLAASLRELAVGGQETLYGGELGSRIVTATKEAGGLFCEEDFAEYQAEWMEPISVEYRGHRIFTTPPNCSSFQVLQTLKTMEVFGHEELSSQDADTLHLQLEAVKLAVADRKQYAGDPEHVAAPLEQLLSTSYAAKQCELIDRSQASSGISGGLSLESLEGTLRSDNPNVLRGTTHLAVADRDGNVVTITQTLGGPFGSGVSIGDTGIFLNNMQRYFDLDGDSPNVIGPGKRVDFVVAPTQTFRDGRFFLSMGTPGSYGILHTTVQLLMNVIDFGMTPQQAIDAPRFRYFGGRQVKMEERYPLNTRRDLESRGHEVEVIQAWSPIVGGAQAIQVDSNQGIFHGGADPRRDGYTFGL